MVYILLRYILSYRAAVVQKNIRIILPDASRDEIIRVQNEYYRYLAHLIIESIWSYRATPEELFPKLRFKNLEKFEEIYARGDNATILISHIGNWELFCQWAPLFIPKLNVVILYTPIQNKSLNDLLLRYRQRFGAHLVSTKSTLELFRIQKTKKVCINLFAIDQNPGDPYHQYWLNFFGQRVPVISGAEKFAKSQSQSAYFLQVNPINGIYELELIDIPYRPDVDYDLTHRQFTLLERNILQNPTLWLLSHNRFKYQAHE